MMERISIQELAIVLTVKNGLKKKEAEQFVNAIFDVVKDNLMSERLVKIKGLGTFKVIDIEPRESVNVNTGERVLIEGHEKITFTPDTAMKELVNKPFSQFETVILNDGVEFDGDDEPSVLSEEEMEEDEQELVASPIIEEPVMIPIIEEPVETPIEEETIEISNEEEPIEVSTEEEPIEVLIEEEEVIEETEILPIVEDEAEESVVEEYASMQDTVADEPVEENEPVEEDEPIEENEPIETVNDEETESESADEDTPELADEEPMDVVVNDESEDIYDEELEADQSSVWKKYLWVVLALVACALSFFGGYQLGVRKSGHTLEIVDTIPVPAKTHAAVTDTVTTKVDTTKQKAIAPSAKPASPAKPAPSVKSASPGEPASPAPAAVPQEKEKVQPAPKNSEVDYQKYEQMDARVRTGAYRIVGTAQEVKVKEGETLTRIAHRILGPEMECYVEVYNGLKANTPLTVGQTIKIPKLELKKKKTQQTINQE